MDKQKFRSQCIHQLKAMNPAQKYYADKVVSNALYRLIKQSQAKVVMLYIPLKIEINIINLLYRLRKEGLTLLVPFMEGKSFRLVKYRLPLSVKNFGIKEPNISNTYYKQIDLAIVPIIGTDRTFRRVGFGKGYYDRFFENHKTKIETVVFVGRKSCITSTVITDHYDVEGDFYITPKRIYQKKKLSNKRI
ncbi:MAG: 5-formyltetrahydrofolate cyclo-ligase [Campylobacterales bacterium]|nr:5-formyltetrahydrofolate cyclo-ligase [Campylobacterales bacterium]